MGSFQSKKPKKSKGGKKSKKGAKETVTADTSISKSANTPTNDRSNDVGAGGAGETGTEGKKSKKQRSSRKLSSKGGKAESEGTEDTSDQDVQEDIKGNLADDLAENDESVGKSHFDLMCVIGRGSFGKVMQVKHKATGKIYAMKVMRKDAIIQKNQVTHTKDEKSILQKIKHPFIVNLHFAFQTEDKLYMILDYVNGGELFFHLKKEGKFNVERVKLYAAEIGSAIHHLHTQGIVYRDLKPENILIDKGGHIVITDFGLSKEIPKGDQQGTHTFCGTPEYLAPEVLRGRGHGHAVDWWSLGTLIYEMLTGLPPFYSKNINVMYQKILNGQLTFPSYIDETCRDLLEGLLTRDPEKRYDGQDLMEHEFFKDIDWDALLERKITPAWKPEVSGVTDTSQIDAYFTNEDAVDSYVDRSALQLDDEDKDAFDGFTYGGEAVLGK
mmetsp:Transcript_314/g.342  ORF Transcript_314/g.342 Transcript_314/m.342 type:complete len:441 (-) Transcript_314:111-1433(-)|eukprot:CAMPEP_0168509106 /NCGR_PEP_ID=MMETSP0405-20121227/559_1 /TAXON_ID=498012 /ORGANISM="Trichosphaerium sp, Strain Am-I-7 wt" /LENGTH=440 /DNA_ID=CAMNT_0008526463 /DNA_START=111 /DNA_END=1433 /DNA_ORIENTATION=-